MNTSHDIKREQRRPRTLKQGFVMYERGLRSTACAVRDLSETGARLQLNDIADLPATFELHVPLDGFKVTCERRWRKGTECGVQFVSPKTMTKMRRMQVLDTPEKLNLASAQNDNQTAPGSAPRPKRTQPGFGRRR